MNVLISYAFTPHVQRADGDRKLEPLIEALAGRLPILLDSGAFSAYSKGHDIDVMKYVDFCRKQTPNLWEYIQLDVVRDKAKTATNLKTMFDAGLKPMPVLTTDAPESVFPHLVTLNHRVCVAGGVTLEGKFYSARIERLWRSVKGQCEIHALGYTRGLETLRSSVASVDSSSWMGAARYGDITLFDRLRGFKKWEIAEVRQRSWSKFPASLKRYMLGCKLSAQELFGEDGGRGMMSPLSITGLHAWMRYRRLCEEQGVKLFFALPGAAWAVPLALILRRDQGEFFDWPAFKRESQQINQLFIDDVEAFADYWVEGVQA